MSLNRENVEEMVRGIICEVLKVSPDEVVPESDLGLDLGADSLNFAEIVLKIGDSFGLELELIDDWDWNHQPRGMRKFGAMVDEICKFKKAA